MAVKDAISNIMLNRNENQKDLIILLYNLKAKILTPICNFKS